MRREEWLLANSGELNPYPEGILQMLTHQYVGNIPLFGVCNLDLYQ